jgi:ABC-2 type transport system ATP-binding protein
VKARLAYVPDFVAFYPWMRVGEALDYLASFRPRWNPDLEKRLLERFQLDPAAPTSGLSKGQRTQLALIGAIAAEPELLVLDEPTSGLDPAQVREFRSLLQALREDASVLLSSHVLAEVEASCDRAVLIDRGQTVAQGTLDELRGLGAASEAVELECDRDASAALGALGAVERATSTALAGGWWRVGLELRRGADASDTCGAVGRALRDAGIAVRRIERAPVELESVFHRILAAGARR